MGISFGWRKNDVRESFWINDPALANVSAAAAQAWFEDGDAKHLRPFVIDGGEPVKITFRNLTLDEMARVRALIIDLKDKVSEAELNERVYLLCFRMGMDFPGQPAKAQDDSGFPRDRVVNEHGIRMLADEYVKGVRSVFGGFCIEFYGARIFTSSVASENEKKASSPPSTLSELPSATASLPVTQEKAAEAA